MGLAHLINWVISIVWRLRNNIKPPPIKRGFLFPCIFITKETTMKKTIRLTESDLTKIVKRVVNENHWEEYGFDDEETYVEDFIEADDYALELLMDMDSEFQEIFQQFLSSGFVEDLINKYQTMFEERYPKYTEDREELSNEHISGLFGLSSDDNYEDISGEFSGALMNGLHPKKI